MNSPASLNTRNSFKNLVQQIKKDFVDVRFTSSDSFYWSGETRTVCYDKSRQNAGWLLLHEVGHMIRSHTTYNSDARLVRMEAEAWDAAKELAPRYSIVIDNDYIQDCIDSYRNWQFLRSKCPVCAQAGVEKQSGLYHCINCQHPWRVSDNRFCRVYRMNNNL